MSPEQTVRWAERERWSGEWRSGVRVLDVLASASRGAGDETQEDVTTIVPALHVRASTPHIQFSRAIESPPRTGATAAMYKQATQKTGEVLSMPAGWLGMYSDFITKNSSAVTQIESALRSLTYIIPGAHTAVLSPRYILTLSGRFRESEIASESRMSRAQLSRNYHD
jgi:hypothetical protein